MGTEKPQQSFPRIHSNLRAAIRDSPQVIISNNDDLSQPFHMLFAVTFGLLSLNSDFPDVPIQMNQLAVDRKQHSLREILNARLRSRAAGQRWRPRAYRGTTLTRRPATYTRIWIRAPKLPAADRLWPLCVGTNECMSPSCGASADAGRKSCGRR